MSRIFIQETDHIRIAVAVSANRARRGWMASYAALLTVGVSLIIAFVERMP